jgi:hypothetical protein
LEEDLGRIQIVREERGYLVRIQTNLGGFREYRASTINKALERMIDDLQEEFEVL